MRMHLVELLLQLQADNQATQAMAWQGKARQLAAEIWSCFEAFEQRVRELPELETDVQAATA